MRSIAARFLLPAGLFAVLLTAFLLYRSYRDTQQHMTLLLNRQAELALEFDLAIRGYVADEVRPAMEARIAREEFHPETMSTSFVARSIFERVRKRFPDCIIKFSSDNPRNPANKAGPDELKMLAYFNSNPQTDHWAGEMQMEGRRYLAHFRARRMVEDCVRCHSDPKDAPESLIQRYGNVAGFHRPLGQVIAMDTVAVPVDVVQARLNAEAERQSVITIGALTAFFGTVTLLFRRMVSKRLAAIAQHFRLLAAQGDNGTAQTIEVDHQDEIGVIAESFNELSAKLRSEHELLEQRVRERTAELGAANEVLELNRFSLEHAPDSVFWLSKDGRFVYVNETSCRQLGYNREELLSMTVHDIDPDFPVERWPTHWEEMKQCRAQTFESHHRRKDGSVFSAEISASYLEFRGTAYIFAFARDITDRKRTETELQKAKEAAEAANLAKSEFLANMSHEIRTPMTAILGYLDVLVSECPGECKLGARRVRTHSEVIERNAQHLLKIIDDILDLSKIEAGRLEVVRSPVSLRQLVDDVESIMGGRAEAKGLSFKIAYEGAAPESICTDPVRLRQILINLIGNAVKFTDAGEVRVTIHTPSGSADDQQILFDVSDTGIGITEADAARLFHPFTQADTSSVRRFGGTGLGLAISKRLAEMLGGAVSLMHSRPGEGSSFRVAVATGDPQTTGTAVRSRASGTAPTSRSTGSEVAKHLLGCHILLAEDTPDTRRLVTYLLEKSGARVCAVENGREAVDRALTAAKAGGPYDVVLLDVQMPVLDGIRATKLLRAEGYAGPIIALTAHAMQADLDACLRAGCDDCATKPIKRELLCEVIRRHLSPVPCTALSGAPE